MRYWLLMLIALPLLGCDVQKPTGQAIETLAGVSITRPKPNAAQLAQGQAVYQQHCVMCHGAQAQGAPQWRTTPGAAPPLNGSGREWTYNAKQLRQAVRSGKAGLSTSHAPPSPNESTRGAMPAFEGTLSEAEIEAVVVWFQSIWPDALYAAWVNQHR